MKSRRKVIQSTLGFLGLIVLILATRADDAPLLRVGAAAVALVSIVGLLEMDAESLIKWFRSREG